MWGGGGLEWLYANNVCESISDTYGYKKITQLLRPQTLGYLIIVCLCVCVLNMYMELNMFMD